MILILGGCKGSDNSSLSQDDNGDESSMAEEVAQQDQSQEVFDLDDQVEIVISLDEMSLSNESNTVDLIVNEDLGSDEISKNEEAEIQLSFGENGSGEITNIAVNNVPDVVGENIVINEGQPIILSDLLANDSDLDADNINILDFSRHSVQGGLIELISSNVLKYTPAENFNGSDSFAYVVSDGRGGDVTAIVNIVVDAINDIPQVTGEEISVPEDESILLMGLVANDFDGDELFIHDYSQGDKGGVVTLIGSNIIKYTPQVNFYGLDSFTYSVSDSKGNLATSSVNVQVQEVNDIPQVVDEVVTMAEDESILLSSLLDNDKDVDADKLEIKTFEQSENGGFVERINENVLRYVPASNFFGTDSFKYIVSDGRGGEVSGTVSIVVAGVNDVPVAKVDAFVVKQGQETEVDVLANDSGVSEEVKVSIISHPKNGNVEVIDGRKVIYTPSGDYFGADNFVYQVIDKDNETSVASAVLDVECLVNCSRIFTISWEPSASENVLAYKVYYGVEMNNLDQVVELDNVTSYNHFVDAKGEYFFAVSSVNDQNMESELTGTVSGVF